MGAGIAQVAAMAGFEVILYDIRKEAVDNARNVIGKNMQGAVDRQKMTEAQKETAFKKIHFTNDFENLKADLLIEAIIEKLEIKQDLFQKLATQNNENSILATNTSSIPITRIAANIPNPHRVVGMHFFNPAHIMKLVEVISGAATSAEVAETVKSVAEKMGKTAVMAKDAPGFIVNRVARHFYVEGLRILEDGVASVEEIDQLVEASGFKMGPFRLMDLIGVD